MGWEEQPGLGYISQKSQRPLIILVFREFMISRLRGILVERMQNGALIIDCQGVGYEVLPTRRLTEKLEVGAGCTVVVFTDVKEDSIRLFGFADNAEREIFNLLLRVSGIGTKTAREIISSMEPQVLLRAIGQRDITLIQSIRGIGRKSAERIVLELRELVAEFIVGDTDSASAVNPAEQRTVADDATAALIALGFARSDSERAVKHAYGALGSAGNDSGKLVAAALQYV